MCLKVPFCWPSEAHRILQMWKFPMESVPTRALFSGKSDEDPILIWLRLEGNLTTDPLTRYPGGGGGTSILKVSGTCRWQGYDFAIIAIKTGCLNQPNHWHRVSKSAYLATGTDYSVYNRVAFPPTMFMTGPRSRHRRDATRRCVRDQYSHDP